MDGLVVVSRVEEWKLEKKSCWKILPQQLGPFPMKMAPTGEDESLDESRDHTLEDRIRAVMDQLESQQAEYHCRPQMSSAE